MTEHIRELIAQHENDFKDRHKETGREAPDGRYLHDFDDQVNFFLLGLVDAAVKDGCPREWLLERFVMLASEAMVAGRKRTPELKQVTADLLLKEAMQWASLHRGKDKNAA